MSELNQEPHHTTAIDTNAEYILPEVSQDQPPVLLSVSKAIIIETVKGFFGSIIGFFLRYIKHFIRCLVYFVNPSLQKKPFDKLDFKENSQHAFEFVIIVLAVLIFMIKLEWIPPSSKALLELYANDLSQKLTEVMLFIMFAVGYLLLAAVAILLGRLLRLLFRISTSVHESDILHVYMNNAFFSIAALITLIMRSLVSWEAYDNEGITLVLIMAVVPSVVIPLLVWGIRFPVLHNMGWGKGVGFFLLSVVLFSIFYSVALLFVCAVAIGI